MKKVFIALMTVFTLSTAKAQGPEITTWRQNTTHLTRVYDTVAMTTAYIVSEVQLVQYSATEVYVSCSSIPEYMIGPWPSNPNTPSNQNFVNRFPRTPVANTGTLTATQLGSIGLWSNGVAIFNAKDGFHWSGTAWVGGPGGTINRNAYLGEGVSFDRCLGHPNNTGCYHNHVNPECLYNSADSTNHSPIIGYAFDGYPIYGAYAYASTSAASGPISRMKSSYVLGTRSASGPPVSAANPLGMCCEDYMYTAGAGDLDEHNGRFCYTPDYPSGTYAYFVTIDASLTPVYPFVIGPTYYGIVQSQNPGTGMATNNHWVITETTTTYVPTAVGVSEINNDIKFQVVPNPTTDYIFIYMDVNSTNNVKGSLYNSTGQLIKTIEYLQPSIAYTLDLTDVSPGIYFLTLQAGDKKVNQKIIKTK